jgi:hypothetical protein
MAIYCESSCSEGDKRMGSEDLSRMAGDDEFAG